jgi:hypothetical protein
VITHGTLVDESSVWPWWCIIVKGSSSASSGGNPIYTLEHFCCFVVGSDLIKDPTIHSKMNGACRPLLVPEQFCCGRKRFSKDWHSWALMKTGECRRMDLYSMGPCRSSCSSKRYNGSVACKTQNVTMYMTLCCCVSSSFREDGDKERKEGAK